jgi:protein-disulfide isomerase
MQADNLEDKESVISPEPEPSAESHPGDVIVISQSTVYYFLTGLLFFIAGFAVAWVTFATRNEDIKNAASSAAQQAVQTAIAEAVGRPAPTATPVPRQDIKFDKDSPAWGSPNAKITIVEYSDFQCPYCEQFYQNAYPLIKKNYGDKVRFVFQNYPLDIHPDAAPAANAAACAEEQGKFWEYHDYLFSHQTDLSHDALIKDAQAVNVGNIKQFTDCFNANKYDEKIKSQIDAGSAYSVGGTPTFFINGTYLAGAQPYSLFKKVIDSELELVGG